MHNSALPVAAALVSVASSPALPIMSPMASTIRDSAIPVASKLASDALDAVLPVTTQMASFTCSSALPVAFRLASAASDAVLPLASKLTSVASDTTLPLTSSLAGSTLAVTSTLTSSVSNAACVVASRVTPAISVASKVPWMEVVQSVARTTHTISNLWIVLRSIPLKQNPTNKAIKDANERLAAAQAAKDAEERLTLEATSRAEMAVEAQRKAEDAARAARDETERVTMAAQAEAELQRETADRLCKAMQAALDAKQASDLAVQKMAEEICRVRAAKEDAERRLREGIRPVIIPSLEDTNLAKRRFDYRDGLIHFAIAGIGGSGKSSLINAFRGLRNCDVGAAAAGIVEATKAFERFPDANPANPVVWYDIAGAGTLDVPDWQYFHDQGLYIFDAVIVLIGDRFTASDIAILRNCRLFNIPSYIVRSKADMHIRNMIKDTGYDSDDDDQDGSSRAALEAVARDDFVSKTRENVERNLKEAQPELPVQRVYIVSNSSLVNVVKGSVPRKKEKGIIDEHTLLENILSDAFGRRGQGSESSSTTQPTPSDTILPVIVI